MKRFRTRSVKNVCWLLFIGICVFHAWFDGRNGALMQELERQGQSFTSARNQLWLCAPLNIATFIVLVLIVILTVKQNRADNRPRAVNLTTLSLHTHRQWVTTSCHLSLVKAPSILQFQLNRS